MILHDPGICLVARANRTGDLHRRKREERRKTLARAGILDEVEGEPGQNPANEWEKQGKNLDFAEDKKRNNKKTCNHTADDKDARDRVRESLVRRA